MRCRSWIVVTSLFVLVFACLPSPVHAAFPGQNGKIAFWKSPSPFTVGTINADGSGQTFLRQGVNPAWSADGQQLLFDDGEDIFRMPADGSSQTVVLDAPGSTAFNEGQWWHSPAWSPDGTRIVAVFEELFAMDLTEHMRTAWADGSGVISSNLALALYPTWRPDGTEIAYVAPAGERQGYAIHAIHPDGTGHHVIWNGITFRLVEYPDYSPDGSKIVFSTDIDDTNSGTRIMVVSSAGGTPVPLTNGPGDFGPAWSPDGTKIVFISVRDGNRELYVMNADGSNQTRITNTPSINEDNPDWQPLPVPYPRPKGATPVRVTLVPAYPFCASPNRTHGPPLAFGSCNPASQESSQLTVGTPDANGAAPQMEGYVRYDTIVGDPSTPADEADLSLRVQISDVRVKNTLADYAGEVDAQATTRMTDHEGAITATAQDVRFPLTTQCAPTADTTIGSTCSLTTTLDTLIPGAVVERARTILQLGQVRVLDGGPDGDTATEPNTVFLRQGLFIP